MAISIAKTRQHMRDLSAELGTIVATASALPADKKVEASRLIVNLKATIRNIDDSINELTRAEGLNLFYRGK